MTEFTLELERLETAVIIRCSGSLAEPAAFARLNRAVTESVADRPHVILDLDKVDYIDSFGLGGLVKVFRLVQHRGGDLRLCTVRKEVARVLTITHLDRVLAMHPTERDAVAALGSAVAPGVTSADLTPDVLCIHSSPEILRLLRELLKVNGLRVVSVGNVADARTLLRAMEPRVVIVGADLQVLFDAQLRERLSVPMLVLEEGFGALEPGAAATRLLDRVTAALASADRAGAG